MPSLLPGLELPTGPPTVCVGGGVPFGGGGGAGAFGFGFAGAGGTLRCAGGGGGTKDAESAGGGEPGAGGGGGKSGYAASQADVLVARSASTGKGAGGCAGVDVYTGAACLSGGTDGCRVRVVPERPRELAVP